MIRRRRYNAVCLTSLAVCLGTAALWVRSFWVMDTFSINSAYYPRVADDDGTGEPLYKDHITYRFIRISRGSIIIRVQQSAGDGGLSPDNLRDWKQGYPQGTFLLWDRGPPEDREDRSGTMIFNVDHFHVVCDRFGFFLEQYSMIGMAAGMVDFVVRLVSVPAWFIVAVAGLLPATRLMQWLRRRRPRSAASCEQCGYNLTANVSGVCPECGTQVSRRPETLT